MQVGVGALWLGFLAITRREIMKFARQPERLLSALIRPAYQEYIVPGLIGMVILFQCMQSALSMVYDREAGVMRVMLVSPLPRSFLLFSKIAAATILSLLQVYAFLLLALVFGISVPVLGWITIIPAVILTGLMLGSIGLLVSVYTPQIENFAGMMNFVVFPMFFLSSALYPLWKLREAGAYPIYYISQANPLTHAIELVRFAAYGQFNLLAFGVVAFSIFLQGLTMPPLLRRWKLTGQDDPDDAPSA